MTSQHKSFGSDNHAGAHPGVLSALMAANAGDATAYGQDPLTERVTARLTAEFGAAGTYLVFGGTAANVLGLGLVARAGDAVICAESAHLNADECGATERVLGSKLLAVPAPEGKLTPELIATCLAGRGNPHKAQPRAVGIAQATEAGTCYTLGELRAIRESCDVNGLLLYIDGARLANAVAYLDCQLADLAAFADVLSFGGTKNGALGAEAVIVMRESLAAAAPFQRMQLMQLSSKMRFLAAQFGALLDGELWRRNAATANAMARRLADGVTGTPGLALAFPVQANAVFATLGQDQAATLQRDWNFHVWAGEGDRDCTVRWMTAFDTTEADVDEFVAAIRATAPEPSPAVS
ncbi:MAG TPA: beta-eliminating lyase-related protein [Streptosporangiaceae bacterium]|nr:beta-eliminating lyase-related protein [Streptosporangiaceae bacterium]